MKYVVAVRALCEFTAKTGDLDLRFTPSPTAQEGMAGHRTVALRRGAAHQRELSLSAEYQGLTVRGRADGWDPQAQRLEEVKTHRGDLARQPANHRALHWAQAQVYGWLQCLKLGLPRIRLALVYFNVDSQAETVFEVEHEAEALRTFFETQCQRFLAWAEQEAAHRAARDAALAVLPFPHAGFRTGQRTLAEAVYKAARRGRVLLAQAPTGIGKTLGTLFPLLRAVPGQAGQAGLDKVFVLTAKGTGRTLAIEAVRSLRQRQPGLPLRLLELNAREAACEHPDKACHGDSCPLAQGFYDKLPAARAAAVADGLLPRARVREIALAHQLCPYWLAQALARWADVVVGDFNHFYDAHAGLHAWTLAEDWRVGVLVDEAHNLVERARGMYSASLSQLRLMQVRRGAPGPVKRALDRLQRQWQALNDAQEADYATHPDVPGPLRHALQQAVGVLAEHLADDGGAAVDAELRGFAFDAMQFAQLADAYGEHSIFDLTLGPPGLGGRRRGTLALRNVVPAPFVGPRFSAAATTVLFSATLAPPGFHADLLGLPADTLRLEVDSPFSAQQLAVHVAGVSTRYRDRAASLPALVALMAAQYRERPGNYLAFFSSFDYLLQAVQAFEAAHPGVPVWRQQGGQSADERDALLARLQPGGRCIGFAVLGGAFAEGIDLPGDRLIGAFIATLGLPPVNPVNEQVKRTLAQRFGRGFDYAYLVPGVQKVVQAAGRVIRTPDDRGVVHLIDDRFRRADVRALLPRWWGLG